MSKFVLHEFQLKQFCTALLLVQIFLFSSFLINGQTNVFAELNGSPMMNTTGWNLTGNAGVGDTPGDIDNFNNELILTTAVGTWQSGAVFWNTPIDLSVCTKWTAEFEFRIWEGSGADGLAFCFLDVPPTGFVSGSGVGIPATANGLKVVLDPFDNCGGPNPELQIFSGSGYDECAAGIVKVDNSMGNLNFLRSNAYQTAKITYDNGIVELYLNNTLYLTSNAPANFTGYMGFTSSTGGLNDTHSIRNVVIFTEQATSDAGPDFVICDGQSIQVGSTNNPLYSYNWINGQGFNSTTISDPLVTIGNTGNIPIYDTLVVETSLAANPGVCPTTDTMIVTIAPHYNQTINVTQCGGSYQWNGTTYQNSGVYTNQFVSSFGCDSIVTLNLTINLVPTVTVTDTTICEGEQAILTAFGAQDYTWNGVQGVANTYSASPLTTTVYEVIGINSNGCADTTYATVNVNPAPVLQISSFPDTICAGDSSVISIVGAATYVWNGAGVSNQSGSTISVFPNQTEIYDVIGTDAIGCSATWQYTIVVVSPPVISITGLLSNICEGDSLTLNASGANLFEWIGPGITNPNANPQLINPQQTSTFEIVGTIGGCTDSLQIDVNVWSAPELNLQLPDVFCAGESDTIIVTGADSYVWSPVVNEISPGVGLIDPTSSTQYTISGTDLNGCSSNISGLVEVLYLPVASFISSENELDLFLSTNVFFSNQSENASYYHWDFGDNNSSSEVNPLHTYPDQNTGDYLVTLFAFNNLGCYDSTMQWIRVEEGIIYHVPNTFTPNEDERNNVFLALFTGGFDAFNFEMVVYNRWGQEVFSSNDVLAGWDGTYQGQTVPEGTYSWMIRFKAKNNDEKKVLHGHVNLIR